MQVFEQPGDPDPLRWVRFSTDPCGHVLSCGNINGRTYVWEPGMGRPHRGVLLAHKQCTRVVGTVSACCGLSVPCKPPFVCTWECEELCMFVICFKNHVNSQFAGPALSLCRCAGMSDWYVHGASLATCSIMTTTTMRSVHLTCFTAC
jgi:hypothetical protein